MAQSIREVMTENPVCLDAGTTITQAAIQMRDQDIGNVLVQQNGKLCGIITDRDIVLRTVAEGKDPDNCTLGDICTKEIVTVDVRDDLNKAIQLMRTKAIRRLPVLEQGKPVGIVSLGDLAEENDPRSVLGEISQAPPNNETQTR